MKLSINNADSKVHTGFGHATLKLISNIGKTNHSLLINRSAPVEMTFAHPQFYIFNNPNAYKIGYTAWESTELKSGWVECLEQIDELWVPNNFCKTTFETKIDRPVYVFHHGVDATFERKLRLANEKIKFLHIGYPALRKNLHDTVEAFLDLYAGRSDVTLTIKSYEGEKLAGIDEPNITIIDKTITYADLVKLIHEHDVLLYPSWGEGFGLIPLQALATGMPVVVTDGWADYDYYMPDLVIRSKLEYNPWQNVHPGKMFKPDVEHLREIMLYCESNIDMLLKRHYEISEDVHKTWAWEKVVSEHFDSVESRLMV